MNSTLLGLKINKRFNFLERDYWGICVILVREKYNNFRCVLNRYDFDF